MASRLQDKIKLSLVLQRSDLYQLAAHMGGMIDAAYRDWRDADRSLSPDAPSYRAEWTRLVELRDTLNNAASKGSK